MSSDDSPKVNEDALKERVKREAAAVTERDARRLVDRQEDLNRKFKAIPGKFAKLINQVKLLYELIRAYVDGSYRQVPWASIATAVAAVLYVLSPIDLIPDAIPGLGYIDDVFVVRLALTMIQSDLATFCEAKGYDLDKYFD
jgi:uncharacterized membrane protein YkvA (DUF1232 family)